MDKALFKKKILKFIFEEINSKHYNADDIESLEVAKQCLENVFQMSQSDYTNIDMEQSVDSLKNKKVVTDKEKAEADNYKNQGNMCLSENLIDDAIECYNKAIQLVDDNPVYYSNRAAAYTNLPDYNKAIDDCRKAIECDPNYSKAYGRLGLVYTNMNEFQKAVDCYKKAFELDPTNIGYKQNLELAKSKLQASGQSTPGPSFTLPGGMDFSNLLSSPQFMNMASQIMSNPNMRTQLTNMMQSFVGTAQSASAGESIPSANNSDGVSNGDTSNNPAAAPMPDLNAFLQMGEQFAQQMRSSNPDLVEQLRNQYMQNSSSQGSNQPEN